MPDKEKGKGKGRGKKFSLTEEDRKLWEYFTRGITPLSEEKLLLIEEAEPAPVESLPLPLPIDIGQLFQPLLPPVRKETQLPYLSIGDTPGVDGGSASRLKKGKYPVDARIDLHGMNQQQAVEALSAFINSAYEQGKRCVLVITGKGLRGESEGVLRSQTPRWLNVPGIREKILSFTYARPPHGGDGALYVLLKKRK